MTGAAALQVLALAMGAEVQTTGNHRAWRCTYEGVPLVRANQHLVEGPAWEVLAHLITVATCPVESNGMGWSYAEVYEIIQLNFLRHSKPPHDLMLPRMNATAEAMVARVAAFCPNEWED